jgi:uncharacterized protein (TIGR02145 family)
MKYSFHIGIALSLLCVSAAFAGCSKDSLTKAVDTKEYGNIRISPVITRANEVNFSSGDQVGLSITRGTETYATNQLMTYSGDEFTSTLAWYPEGADSSVFSAYYPYQSSGVPTSFSVKTDQTSGIWPSDLMAAHKSGVLPSENAVSMVFKHQLTKLVILLTNDSKLTISSVTLENSIPTAKVDIPNTTVTVDKSAAAASIKAYSVSATQYEAIVVPQTVVFKLTVSAVNGKELSQRTAEVTLKAGAQYSISATVLPEDLKVKISGDIETWSDEGEIGKYQVPFEEHDGYFLYDNDKYPTVTLSNGQTWMNSPMHYVPDGYTPSQDPTSGAHIYYPYTSNGTAVTVQTSADSIAKYGYLYDFQAAFNQEVTPDNYTTFEGVQGICPKGWHVPTWSDYMKLVGYSVSKTVGSSATVTDATALFYNSTYNGAKVTDAEAGGWKFFFSGYVMKNTLTANASYQALTVSATNSTYTRYYGRHSLNYEITSTPYNVRNAGTDTQNIQFMGLLCAFSKALWPEGKLSLSYANYLSGNALRCVKN